MIIDILKLRSGNNDIDIDTNLDIDSKYLENTMIRKVDNIHFKGKIKKNVDDTFNIVGVLSGKIIIPDNITLEDYNYNFSEQIDEEIDENVINNQKTLDIIEILWQNILVEIPLKVVNEKNEHLDLKGEGWRLISEDDLDTSNNPFSDLDKLLNNRKEK